MEQKFKFGRLPPKNARALQFKDIRRLIPEHPPYVKYLDRLSNWQVLGNNWWGNCNAVATAQQIRFVRYCLTGEDVQPTQEEVNAFYSTQNFGFVPDPDDPVMDNGMEMQTGLEYLHHWGWPSDWWTGNKIKLVAFAKVDIFNLEEVKAAQFIFGGLLSGVAVQDQNLNDFDFGKVWDYHESGFIQGGHAMMQGSYYGSPINDMRNITWGREVGLTDNYWEKLVCEQQGELWIAIWPWYFGTKQFDAGIDLNRLASAYKELTHSDLPVPEPQPIPIPDPTPEPIPEPEPEPTPEPIPTPDPEPIPEPTPEPIPPEPEKKGCLARIFGVK